MSIQAPPPPLPGAELDDDAGGAHAALEPVGRGASMGALGRVRGNGDLELALTIRTFAIAAGTIHLWVGGGIVWAFAPRSESGRSVERALSNEEPAAAARRPQLPA